MLLMERWHYNICCCIQFPTGFIHSFIQQTFIDYISQLNELIHFICQETAYNTGIVKAVCFMGIKNCVIFLCFVDPAAETSYWIVLSDSLLPLFPFLLSVPHHMGVCICLCYFPALVGHRVCWLKKSEWSVLISVGHWHGNSEEVGAAHSAPAAASSPLHTTQRGHWEEYEHHNKSCCSWKWIWLKMEIREKCLAVFPSIFEQGVSLQDSCECQHLDNPCMGGSREFSDVGHGG